MRVGAWCWRCCSRRLLSPGHSAVLRRKLERAHRFTGPVGHPHVPFGAVPEFAAMVTQDQPCCIQSLGTGCLKVSAHRTFVVEELLTVANVKKVAGHKKCSKFRRE